MDDFSSNTSLSVHPSHPQRKNPDLRKSPSVLNCFIFVTEKAIDITFLRGFFKVFENF